MTDKLIRREDALAAMKRAKAAYLKSTDNTPLDFFWRDAIAALPAVTMSVKPLTKGQTRAANFMACALWSELHEGAGEGVLPKTLPKAAADLLRELMREKLACDLAALEPVAAPAQCCMCGKRDLSTAEDGGPECELPDGRWVCSRKCHDTACSLLEPVNAPAGPSESAVYARTGLPPVTVAAPAPAAIREAALLSDAANVIRDLMAAYSKPDEQLCCNGRECGCQGATVQMQAEYYANEFLALIAKGAADDRA